MVARERLARLQLHLRPSAVLTAVAVAGEEECVRDLAAETARDVDEPREPDDRRAREGESLGTDDTIGIRFDDLGLAVDDETKGATKRNHRQWLERSIESETAND